MKEWKPDNHMRCTCAGLVLNLKQKELKQNERMQTGNEAKLKYEL